MKICVIGTGYVGLTTGSVLADMGHYVSCVDIDQTKIKLLNTGEVPIFEPGLDEIVKRNINKGTLFFSTKIPKNIAESEIVIIAVGTPPQIDGSPNLSYVRNAVQTISESINSYKVIITKSTVPPGTNEWIEQVLLENGVTEELFDVVSNPEFLKEGTAIKDLLNPDKTVIGSKSQKAIKYVKEMYKDLSTPFIITSLTGAELIKYASNAFLATKISFMNEMARICDAYGVNVEDIEKGIGTDPRIGSLFLKAGLGYGGSCFPKDISALQYSARNKGVEVSLLEATMKVNETQVTKYIDKLSSKLPNLKGRRISVWGLTFKPNTDDIRLSQSIRLIQKLLDKECHIHAYDPQIHHTDLNIKLHNNKYNAIQEADALILATDWEEFYDTDWKQVKEKMKGNIFLDGRNIVNPKTIEKCGLKYLGLGRS